MTIAHIGDSTVKGCNPRGALSGREGISAHILCIVAFVLYVNDIIKLIIINFWLMVGVCTHSS